ncbi:MAG TPA: hypothetical protein VFH27_02470 [Longimicrobiaceae bacterium]|nr:hypothetical protein [Longimicrobiaceae bacterium]
MNDASQAPAHPNPPPRRRWTAPRVEDMPLLTDLTLQTFGGSIDGGGGSGGSTVF